MTANEKLKSGKKISRKDIANMSRKEVLSLTLDSYIRLLSYIKPYKARFYLGIFFSVLYGLFAGIMLFFIKFILGVTLPASVADFNFPGMQLLIKWGILDPKIFEGITNGEKSSLTLVVAAAFCIPVLFGIRGMLQYLSNYCMLWVSTKILYDIRSDTFSSLLKQSLNFFNSEKTGLLIQTVFNQTRMVSSNSMAIIMSLIKHPIAILSIVAYLFYQDWLFAVSALFLFPLSILPVILVSQKIRKAGGDEEKMAGGLMVNLHETFSGIRVVKTYAREDFELKRFNRSNKSMAEFIMRWRKAMEIVGPMMETVASIGIGTGLIYAWYKGMGAGDFLILFMSLIAIYPHAKALSRINIMLQKCLVAISQVFKIVDTKPEISDLPDAKSIGQAKGKIEFKNVTFAYKKNENDLFEPAIKNLNFTFEAGKNYALVGNTGAGKTTIFSLLLRLYDIDQGSITLDGVDIKELKQQNLRNNIGLVNQDVFLFHDTVYQNILYGRLDATEDEIIYSAKHAHAHNFIIDEKTGGYDSMIGEAGAKLSGGQKQRLTIARAILRNAPILLLDEATSAIDSETELKIKDSLEELSKGKTTIAIAHRLSTILKADEIIYLENGEIKQTGTHHELMKSSAKYKNLYNLQFAAAEEIES